MVKGVMILLDEKPAKDKKTGKFTDYFKPART